MKSLEEYQIKDRDGLITYESPICHLATIVRTQQENSLNFRIMELTESLFNQWRLTIETYQRLRHLFLELNKRSKVSESGRISGYNMYASFHELEFKDYSYLLVISLKTFMDLFASLVDISLNKVDRRDNLPDFFSLGGKKFPLPSEVKEEWLLIKSLDEMSWIHTIRDIRNKLIHRGYQLSIQPHLDQGTDLVMNCYRGNNTGIGNSIVKVGELYGYFLTRFPVVERTLGAVVARHLQIPQSLIGRTTFRIGDLVNNSVTKEPIK